MSIGISNNDFFKKGNWKLPLQDEMSDDERIDEKDGRIESMNEDEVLNTRQVETGRDLHSYHCR